MNDPRLQIAALLGRTRRRWQAVTALSAWTAAAAIVSLILALALGADRLSGVEGVAAVALWCAAGIAALAAFVWQLAPLRRAPSDGQVARFIEERCPELEDALVTAVGEKERTPGPMADAVEADAVRRSLAIDDDRIIGHAAMRQARVRAAAATILVAVLGALAIAPAFEAARLLGFYLFPGRLDLAVSPGDVRIRAGEGLRILASVNGAGAVVPVLRVDEGGASREMPMAPAADGFAVVFDRIEQGFRYVVAAAGASTREYTVTVLRPPRVERIDVRYEYPPAFGLEPRLEEDGGDIYGPAGTRVHVTIHPDKPVVSGALSLTAGQPVPLTAREGVLEGQLTITREGSYRVALADEEGLTNPGDTEYFIRTLEDRPPLVRIVRPAADRRVTSIEEVAIEASADDDFGVAALDLVYAVRGGAEVAVPFERSGSGLAVTGRQMLYLEELDLSPGDFVTYYARARDVSRGKRSSEARSDIFFLEIAPFDEEFVAAESQGGGGGPDEQNIEQMAQAQKDIITATWSLDRRALESGAQSRDDVRTVARAQRDLHGRAAAAVTAIQRAMDLRRRRDFGRPGGARQPDPTLTALRNAADAMGTAQRELEGGRTTAALPHEMTALNELLRAQAEVRRREVQRQQQANGATGGRGSNRQQQDMSSLFDQELSRQQTNYETPPGAETRQEQARDETLDKIRELARRQDELNREQQALAEKSARTADEEMRRALERLTRDQSELRRQAEELARQLQQGGPGGQGQQLQQISEDMQEAASELRRENPGEATARGARAAEGLRNLEQQLRSQRPEDRRRAAGELQLESRQLAEAQRNLAGESADGRGGKPDERARRLAEEQQRLADRTQRLEEAVRKLAGAGDRTSEAEQKALSEAAQEVEEQRLSQRMRDAAKQLQPGANGRPQERGSTKQAADEIARGLDRLAGRLGAASGQNEASQRLTDELSRLRDVRERLAELDRELGELRERGDPQKPEGGGGTQPWEQAQALLEELRRLDGLGLADSGVGFNPGLSAPGTESWKQDFAAWDELKVQVAAALERAERKAVSQLHDAQSSDRLSAGATQSVPDRYRQLVDDYYRALAKGSQR